MPDVTRALRAARALLTRHKPVPPPRPAMETEPIVYDHPDPVFRGPAYEYLRADDPLPTESGLPADPTCVVKLFMPVGRFTLYIVAADVNRDGVHVAGFVASPLGPEHDGFVRMPMAELVRYRAFGLLPIERDLDFRRLPLSEVKARSATGSLP